MVDFDGCRVTQRVRRGKVAYRIEFHPKTSHMEKAMSKSRHKRYHRTPKPHDFSRLQTKLLEVA